MSDMIYKICQIIYRLFKFQQKKIIGKNNTILDRSLYSKVEFDILGDNNTIIFSNGCILSSLKVFISGDNHLIEIDVNCNIKNCTLWLEDNNGTIKIGKGTTIESAHIACSEPGKKIIIGNDCMFSDNIQIRTGDSHSIFTTHNSDISKKYVINSAKDINVNNHVWIGANCVILKGVNIGQNSVIGIGTIVTKNVPENCVFAGVPGRIIKTNINWSRVKMYNQPNYDIIDNNN